ncbi:MAG: type II toxin-antitoxin system prevent-host-death family antitoxin [Thermoclostridium sp.]|nr:type II toxin-antitoxin system prevent-host-death family antitoxin [Thermoclostridium sp.]
MKTDEGKTTITATELKNNLGLYLDSAISGQEVIITKNGKNAARLISCSSYQSQPDILFEESAYYEIHKKVSYEEFLELNDNSDARMEYINGEIIMLSSHNVNHQDISGRLYLMLSAYLKGKRCRVYYAPFEVTLFKKNIRDPDVVQPDLLIACDIEEKVNAKGKYMGVPALVIEILSAGTRTKDMVDKLNTYMMSGVQEYWVVDPVNQSILVYGFRENQVDDFKTYRSGDVLQSYFFDDLEAEAREIFNCC